MTQAIKCWTQGQVSKVRSAKGQGGTDLVPRGVGNCWPIDRLHVGRVCKEQQLLATDMKTNPLARNLVNAQSSMRIVLREQGIRARIVIVGFKTGTRTVNECAAGTVNQRGGWTFTEKEIDTFGYAAIVYTKDIIDGKSKRPFWWCGITSKKDERNAQEGWPDRIYNLCKAGK